MVVASSAAAQAGPFWSTRPDRLQNATVALSLVASTVDVIRMLIAGEPAVLVGAVLALVGAVVARRFGWAGLVLTLVGTAVALASGWDPIVQYSVVAFTVFGLTLGGLPPVRTIGFAAGSLAAIFVVVDMLRQVDPLSTDASAAVAAACATGAIGLAIRLQLQYWKTVELRARDAAERGALEAERRAAEERLRIARDLHDVIGHNIAVISMQLGAVEVSAGRDEALLTRSLQASRDAVQAVLAETQQTLHLLRAGPDEPAGRPAPNLDGVADLLSSFEQIGLRVVSTLELGERDRSLDGGVELVAYRVVQEALTNALRYGSGEAEVVLDATGSAIRIEVANPVAGQGLQAGSGYGLVGMAERVASVGGTLSASAAEGAFRVRAVLPRAGRRAG